MSPNEADEIYLAVARELAAGVRDEALWIKAFALENGDEAKTKAHYIRMRVAKLSEAQTTRANDGNLSGHQGAVLPKGNPDALPQPKSNRSLFRIVVGVVLIAAIGVIAQNIYRENNKATKPLPTSPVVEKNSESVKEKELPFGPWDGVTSKVDGSDRTIWLNGEITDRMAKHFQEVLNGPEFPRGELFSVWINSEGGDLRAAMEIGRAIRTHEFSVVGVDQGNVCFSSCVFIYAGGEQRIPYGKIGIHRPYAVNPSSSPKVAEKWFEQLSLDAKKYLREMRIREALFDDMVNVPPDQIYIFKSIDELTKYGLLLVDPVAEERNTAVSMKRYGIVDRQVYMERRRNVKGCTNQVIMSHNECAEKVMSGVYRIQ